MPAPKLSKEEVVQRLFTVFRANGYDGASLALLSEATGLGKSSLYHYFPNGKEDMVNAVFAYTGDLLAESVLKPLTVDGDPEDRLREAIKGLVQFYDVGKSACLIEAFASGSKQEVFSPLTQSAAAVLEAGLLKTSKDSGHTETEAARLAEDALVAIQGALVVSRVKKDTAPFRRVMVDLPGKLLA